MADRQANIWLRLKNAKGVGSSLRRLGGGFLRLGKRAVGSIAGIGRSLLSLKSLILTGLVYGALRVAWGAFKTLTAAASDAQETAAKFGTVFARLTEPAKKWAAAIAKATGQANTQIKGWMATLQDTFVPLGMTEDAAFGLTKQITELGIDLASFNPGTTGQEAIEALTSAIIGNHETVRRFGIIIDEAALKTEAYASGIAKSGSKLTIMQKVQARVNLIMNSSKRAMGDAVRTSKDFKNVNVRLASTWLTLKERLGTFLINSKSVAGILDTVGESVQRLTKWFEENEDAIQSLVDKGFGVLSKKADELSGDMLEFVESGDLADWAKDTAEDIKTLADVVEGVGRGLGHIFYTIKTASAAAATAMSFSAEMAAKAGRALGVVSQETVDDLEGLRRAYQKTAAESFEAGQENVHELRNLLDEEGRGVKVDTSWLDAFKPELAKLLKDDIEVHVLDVQGKLTTEKQLTAMAEREVASETKKTLDLMKQQKGALEEFGAMGRLKREVVVNLLQRRKGMTAEEAGRLTGQEREVIAGYEPLKTAYAPLHAELAKQELSRGGVTDFSGMDLSKTTPDKIEATAKVEVVIKAGEDIVEKVGETVGEKWQDLVSLLEEAAEKAIGLHQHRARAAAVALREAG